MGSSSTDRPAQDIGPDPAALFDVPDPFAAGHRKGSAELAVEDTIAGWVRAGRDIDPATSRMLRAQGFAVDLAIGRRDAWQVGNATRGYLDLVNGFGLVTLEAVADPFAAAMREAMAADGFDGGDVAGSAVRDSAE
jgi:hypothetical protein